MFRNTIIGFPEFLKKIYHEHDISRLNLDINKTQVKILMTVDENAEKSMSEISDMVGLEKSSFSRSVDHLVEEGFLKRNHLENNRRTICLSLTEKGTKAAKKIRDDLDTYLESLLVNFSEKDKNDFFKALRTTSLYMQKILNEMNR
jgi:DNA-binding MarR family transcriptional regulator